MTSLVMSVDAPKVEAMMRIFKELTGVKEFIVDEVLLLFFNHVDLAAVVSNFPLLQNIAIHQASGQYPRRFSYGGIDSLLGCRLVRVCFTSSQMLAINDFDTLSKCSGGTMKELCLSLCPNVDDSCLFDINLRFPCLSNLHVLQCSRIRGTFLKQNYSSFDRVPNLRTIKLMLVEKPKQYFIVKAVESVQMYSKNKVQLTIL